MSPVTVELAKPDDEPELRRLMREVPMPGAVSLAFEREPSFWASAEVGADHADIVVARSGDRLVGVASHAVRWAFVDGAPRRLGYLSALRVEPTWRGQRVTPEGFALIRRLMEREGCPFCVSTIVDGNDRALASLATPRQGFPAFAPRERICTLAFPTWRRRAVPAGFGLRRADHSDLPGIAECLQRNYERRQFAPIWSVEDLADPVRTRGLSARDFTVAEQGGRIAGCVAVWDQSHYKQLVVRGYSRGLRACRGVLNVAAPYLNVPRLPRAGQGFAHAYLSHLAADDDDPPRTLALLSAAYESCRERRLAYLTTGLSEHDRRLRAIRRHFGGLAYWSTLFTVAFDSGRPAVAALDGRPAHLEVAVL